MIWVFWVLHGARLATPSYAELAAGLGLVFAAAVAFHYALERPLVRWARMKEADA